MKMDAVKPAPSRLAMVPFVSVDHMMEIMNGIGARRMMRELADYIEADFRRWESFDKFQRGTTKKIAQLPTKVTQIR